MSEAEIKYSILFSRNLKAMMEKYGISQAELAKRMGVSAATISDWVTAKKSPRVDKIDKLIQIFNCKRSDFLADEPDPVIGQALVYNDPATEELIKAVHDRPELRQVFEAARDVAPEDLQQVIRIIETFRRTSKNG